jgi:hypothetical protein
LVIHLQKEHRLGAFKKKVLRRTFRLTKGEVTGSGEKCIMRSCIIQMCLAGKSHGG